MTVAAKNYSEKNSSIKRVKTAEFSNPRRP